MDLHLSICYDHWYFIVICKLYCIWASVAEEASAEAGCTTVHINFAKYVMITLDIWDTKQKSRWSQMSLCRNTVNNCQYIWTYQLNYSWYACIITTTTSHSLVGETISVFCWYCWQIYAYLVGSVEKMNNTYTTSKNLLYRHWVYKPLRLSQYFLVCLWVVRYMTHFTLHVYIPSECLPDSP